MDDLRNSAPSTDLLMYSMKDDYIVAAMTRPGIIVGSDAMPYLFDDGRTGGWDTPFGTGKGHLRGAGTHAKVLRMVREDQKIPLMDAISEMTDEPANFPGPHVAAMRTRAQGVNVTDTASFEEGKNTLPSTGIPHVIVNGEIVVKHSRVRLAKTWPRPLARSLRKQEAHPGQPTFQVLKSAIRPPAAWTFAIDAHHIVVGCGRASALRERCRLAAGFCKQWPVCIGLY